MVGKYLCEFEVVEEANANRDRTTLVYIEKHEKLAWTAETKWGNSQDSIHNYNH